MLTEESTNVEILSNSVPVTTECSELEITAVKKEYNIVGDGVYIASSGDGAPQWLYDIVEDKALNAVDEITTNRLDGITTALSNLENTILSGETSVNNRFGIIETGLESIAYDYTTLESYYEDNKSNIINLNTTKVDADTATALALTALHSEVQDNTTTLGSRLFNIDQTITTKTNSLGQRITGVVSTLNDETTGLLANSSATENLYSYVGIDKELDPTGTGLLATINIIEKQNDGVIDTYAGTHYIKVCDLNLADGDSNELLLNQYPYALWTPMSGTVIPTATTRIVYRDAVSSYEPILTYTLYTNTITNLKYMYSATTSTWSEITENEYNNYEETLRSAHIGDVYILYAIEDGTKVYKESCKFVKTAIDTTSPYATDTKGYAWLRITDTDAQNAYMQALNAYDLADNKRRVFVDTPAVPYDIGDLWTVQTGATIIGTVQGGRTIQAGDLLRCTETKTKTGLYEHNDWVPADNYRESMNAIQTDLNNWRTGTYSTFVTNIQGQVDLKAETFYQPTIPTGRLTQTNVVADSTLDKYVGDLWKNTYVGTISGYLGDNTEYIYTKTANGSKWNYGWTKMEVPDIVFDTMDTKKSIYTSWYPPVSKDIVPEDIVSENDMWIPSIKTIYSGTQTIKVNTTYTGGDKYTFNAPSNVAVTIKITVTDAEGAVHLGLNNVDLGSMTGTNNETKIYTFTAITKTATAPAVNASNELSIWSSTSDDGSFSLITIESTTYTTKEAYVYTGTAWQKPFKYTDDTAAIAIANGSTQVNITNYDYTKNGWSKVFTDDNYTTKLSAPLASIATLEETNDGVVNSFFQTTAPISGHSYGDWWVDTDSSPLVAYRYEDANGKSVGSLQWKDNSNSIIGKAYIGAVGAQATADGKIKTFYQNSIPTSDGVGDLWIDTDDNNKTYRASIKGANEIKVGEWEQITDESALDSFITTTFADSISDIEQQLDGVGVTYFQATRPVLSSSIHNGDIWYDISKSYSYAEKFKYINGVGTWTVISDVNTLNALKVTSETKAAADGVIHTYVQITEPTIDVGVGDIWFKNDSNSSAGNKDIYTYTGTDGDSYSGRWNKVGTFVNTIVNLDISQALIDKKSITTYVADEIDKEVVVYSGTATDKAALTGMKLNDIYIEKATATGVSGVTVDVVNTYKYNGTAWAQIGNNSNLTALADLADGKRTIFSNNTSLPQSPKVRDMWIPSSTFIDTVPNPDISYIGGEIYLYNGTSWVIATKYSADISALTSSVQTQLDGKVDTYYQTTVPFRPLTLTDNITDVRSGDYWYCTETTTTANVPLYSSVGNKVLKSEFSNGTAGNWSGYSSICGSCHSPYGEMQTKIRDIFEGNTFPVTVNDTYIVTCDVYSSASTYPGHVGLYCMNSAGGSVTWIGVPYLAGQGWYTISGTLTIPAGTVQARPWIQIDTSSSPISGYAAFSRINIQKVYTKGIVYKLTPFTIGTATGYDWVPSADVSKYAFDLADGKAAIYTTASKPNTYKINDLLIVIANNDVGTYTAGVVLTATATRTSGVFTASEWTKKINDTEDLDAFVTEINPKVTTLQNQIDGTIEYYYDNTVNPSETDILTTKKNTWTTKEQREAANGNVYYFTTTQHGYWYSSKTDSWNSLTDVNVLKAVIDAANAANIANGKMSVYFAIKSESAVTGYTMYFTSTSVLKKASDNSTIQGNVGDELKVVTRTGTGTTADPYKYDYSIYTKNGTSWAEVTPGGLVATSNWAVNLDSKLKDTSGAYFGADSNIMTSTKAQSNGTVETAFTYSTNTKLIGGQSHNAGFGLKTISGAGTVVSPYESEFWVKADKFKIISASDANYKPFSIDASTNTLMLDGTVTFKNSKTGRVATLDNTITNSKNIIANDWTVGTGSTSLYNIYGSTNENERILFNSPFGENCVVWRCNYATYDNGPDDGGWITAPIAIDRTKMYRFSCWVLSLSSSSYTGLISMGIGNVNSIQSIVSLNTTNSTPATSSCLYGSLPTIGEWYQIVSYIYPYGTIAATNVGGLYDKYGKKYNALNQIGFNWSANVEKATFYCIRYNNTTTPNVECYFYNPTLEVIDGTETQLFKSLETTIDGSNIRTGSIWADGNIKSTNYNWNSGYPVGFGLFSIGDSDSQESYNIVGGKLYGATINGANIKGAVFDIATAKMQSAVEGNTGSFIPTSLTFGGGSLQSDYFYAPGYGTGYNPNRIARDTTEFLIKCTSGGSFALYYQINDGAWTAFSDCGPSNPSYITYVGRNTYSFSNGKIRFKAVTTSGNTTLSLDVTAPAIYVNRFKAIYSVYGTYSFTVPTGITSIEYIVYGAGGGSGANNRNGDQDSGSGGGAGGKITGTISVTPGETLTVIVGEKGYGASYHFNSNYQVNYNDLNVAIGYGTGTAGGSSYLKRGSTTIATATGGQPGWQTGSGAAGGTPYVEGTNNGYGSSSILYYVGAIPGGTNGSGTPPTTYSAGSGYGNGGGQSTATKGTNGQNGAVLLYWESTA